MSRWSRKGAGRPALLPLLLLALALGGTALYLASLNLLLTTTAWGRSLCQGWAQQQQQQQQVHPLQDPSSDTQIFYQNVWEKHQFLYQKLTEERRRHRRSAKDKKNRPNNRKPILAAHYEVKPAKGGTQMNVDSDGTIRYWTEVPRNSTSPVKYNDASGEFIVSQKGLYYLYCQVHFNEDRSSYIKLDLHLDGNLIFRCLQEFSATAASIGDPKLKTCSVSGLVVLQPRKSLRISTLPKASLRVDHFLTYFGLFQLNPLVPVPPSPSIFFLNLHAAKQCKTMPQVPPARVLPELARGIWTGLGAWLGVLLCIIALAQQSIHLGNLQRELSLLRRSKEDSKLEVRRTCEPPMCSRRKREVPGNRKQRHNGSRCLLHLAAESVFSNVSNDFTVISWKVSLQRGKALEVQGTSVRVQNSGIYIIYSQVFYTDNTFTMGHLVLARADGETGDGELLLRCVQSMPKDKDLAYNTCYTSGVFSLQKGTTITLRIPRPNASLNTSSDATFLGFVKL
ncbi:uncharacterized protein LOC134934157 [Pseudophryne corroboree]|uniref:uncharacterized protein LOC134934157 n=1 Tax=Pseudophryne corroboree TaxID=495146 RepID=UPI003081A390